LTPTVASRPAPNVPAFTVNPTPPAEPSASGIGLSATTTGFSTEAVGFATAGFTTAAVDFAGITANPAGAATKPIVSPTPTNPAIRKHLATVNSFEFQLFLGQYQARAFSAT
jgi:hypothetical protein